MAKEATSSYLRLHPTLTLDCASVVAAPASTLIRGLHTRCLCFHPTKPLLAVGVSGYIAVYDIQSNTRIGRVDLKSLPVDMAFAPDGTVLVIATQDWVLCTISTASWRVRQLVPRRAKMDKPLESCLLAVAPGHSPFVYFCRYAKDTVRLATLAGRPAAAAGGKAEKSSGSWGNKVKLDVQKAVLGLACHPVDQQLLVLTADGQLRGYAITGSNGELSPMYNVQVQDAAEKSVPAEGALSMVPHPGAPGGAIILQASRLGTAAILEAPGRAAPTVLARGKIPGWIATLGMGLSKATNTLVAFGLSEGGRLRCNAWRLQWRPGAAGVVLLQGRVEPQDLAPLLDHVRAAKASAAAAGTSPAALTALLAATGRPAGGAAASFGGGLLQPAAPGAAATPASSSSAWQALWSTAPAWSTDISSSCLLDAQLGPLVMRVAVHPSLDCVACQLEPSFTVQTNRGLLMAPHGQLANEEMLLARRTCSVPLLALTDHEAHHQGWRGAMVAPQHTGLATWQPPLDAEAVGPDALASPTPPRGTAADATGDTAGAAGSSGGTAGKAVVLPPHTYYLAGHRVMKYSLTSRLSGTLSSLPAEAADGSPRVARQVLHSAKQGAWLVLLDSLSLPGSATSGDQAARSRWGWALINGKAMQAMEGKAGQPWVLAGKYGAFLGPADEYVAIMGQSGRTVAVFPTDVLPQASTTPLFTISLEGSALTMGLAAPIFAGPPMTNAPVPEPKPAPSASGTTVAGGLYPHHHRYRGSGVVLWQAADHCLAMATLPAMSRVPLDGDSSEDDENAAPGGGQVPPGHHFGVQPRQASLPLLPGETVLYVTWQQLSATAPAGPDDCAAAVLTTQRLMIVTAALRLVASTTLATHGSALPDAVTSVMWAGPMLLYSTQLGQVMQLCWNGVAAPVCTISPTGYTCLLGVTTDAVLLLRTPLAGLPTTTSGNSSASASALTEVIVRPAYMLQPLMLGWASLAATGLLPGGAATARPALQHVLSAFDPSVLTPRGIWGLISAGAWDVAAAVANYGPGGLGQLDPEVKLAANAAAGRWAAVQSTLVTEAERALHAPAPPPRGSALHAKLVAAAAGALFHGQLAISVQLFQAAGEWASAMVVAVCQGNVQGVYGIAQKVGALAGGGQPTAEALSAGALASALRSVYGTAGTMLEDAELKLTGGDLGGGALEGADKWQLGAAAQLGEVQGAPAAVTSAGNLPPQAVADRDEVGPIPPCDANNVIAYYGLTATAAASVAAAAPGAAARGAALAKTASGRPVASQPSPGGDALETTSVASSDAAQAAARAEFFSGFGGGGAAIDFSSDDDDSEATSGAGTLGGGGLSRRIKIQIRDNKDGSGAGGTHDLKEAAKGLKLQPPSAGGGAPSRFAPGGIALSPPPSQQHPGSLSAAPSLGPAPSLTQFPPGISSAELYTQGTAFMEAADWRTSAAHFSRAMAVLCKDEAAAPSTPQRLAFCAQYYAAVRMLEVATAAQGPREAKLYRYAASLGLDERHAQVLLREAITRNKAARNYRYAGDQLTALIGRVADSAPAEYLALLQGELEECDRQGGGNKDIASNEQLSDWVACVAAATSKEDVDLLVVPLMTGS